MYKFNINNPIKNKDIYIIKKRLEFLNYLVDVTDGLYDTDTMLAIKKFQLDKHINVTGDIDKETYNKIFAIDKIRYAEATRVLDKKNEVVKEEDKHFDKNNKEIFKKSNLEIKIKYGKNKVIKLKDVILYNKDQAIDANGDAVYDVYQFVANDLID